jgi:D-glycero-D-manno-heptose 1,7-bisphosphate phosphatase
MRAANHPLNSAGIWCEVLTTTARGQPALFLDRDGALVEETEYLCRVEDIKIIPGAAKVIAAANKRGVAVILVTNQAGIGRGYYGWAEFMAVQQAIVSALAAEHARLDAVYACPHHPEGRGAFAHPDHPARKPNPGMLLQAAADLALDLERSWLVGDRVNDLEAAKRAGIAGALHVLTGYGEVERSAARTLTTPSFEVRLGRSISDALSLPLFLRADAAHDV